MEQANTVALIAGLRADVAELERRTKAAELARADAEAKAANLKERVERASVANWQLRQTTKTLRADGAKLRAKLAELEGKSGPVEQLRHVKAKLRVVANEARAMQAAATETIATQAEAIRTAEDRIAKLEAVLGPDLAGRPFSELLVAAANALEVAGGGPLATALYAKASEVAAVQPVAKSPVIPTPVAA